MALRTLASPLVRRATSAAAASRAGAAVLPGMLGGMQVQAQAPVMGTAQVPQQQQVRAFSGTATARGGDGVETIQYPPPKAFVSQPAPAFAAPAVIDGEISNVSLEEYTSAGKWTVLVFYPKDFTFVCPTELIQFSDRHSEFEAVNAQVVAISTDTAESHLAWTRLNRKMGGLGFMDIPLVADVSKQISCDYGVLHTGAGIALRGLCIIDPQGVLQQMTINNFPVGRDVDEALRLIQAFQFVAEHGEVCPAGWKPGAATMVPHPEKSMAYFGSANEDDADVNPLETSQNVTRVSTPAEFEAARSSGKVVVDFAAPWCGKCKQIMPLVNELADQHSDVNFVLFDTSEPALADLAAELGANSVPLFQFYKDGEPFGEAVQGYKKKPLRAGVEALANA